MRELKFRGKNITTDEWVYGSLVNNLWTYASHHSLAGKNVCEIITTESNECDDYEDMQEKGMNITVHPDSVGQFTGLKDKYGNEIYEGDICESIGYRFKVGFKNGAFSAEYSEKSEDCFYLGNADESRFEIIGNIYENPELLHK